MKPHSGSKITNKFKMAAMIDQNDSIAVSECMSILQRGSDP